MKADTGGGGGGGGVFSEQVLAEKLSKLNNSQQSIETLSQWCIFHRKRAKQVVETWEKQFNNATKDQKVSFLYLSNDILQNSKRKGGEFVNEFWKVLPRSLKIVYENGEENGKKVVTRLIEIWDERRVFGSRSRSLKDDVLGDNPPTLDNDMKSSNPSSIPTSNSIKGGRKDSNTIRIKLAVGGMPEKIVTAYQSVLDQHFDEDTALNKCKNTVSLLEKMDREVHDACTHGIQQGSSLISDLQEQEAILKQCIQHFENVEAIRTTLINQLKEALSEQEAKSELIRSQLLVARAEAEHAMQLRQRLGGSSPVMITLPSEQMSVLVQSTTAVRPISPKFQPPLPATSLPGTASTVGDEYKKTAAAMADKLASSSSSVQMLSSIISSLVAEEAASMNGGSPSREHSAGPPGFPAEKRPRLEKPMPAGDMGAPPFFGQVPQAQQQIGPAPTSVAGMQPPAQATQAPTPFPPPPPPLPPVPPPPLMQQFGQNAGGMAPFGMMGGSLPPPPPLSNIFQPGFPRPSGPSPPPLPPPAQSQPQQQQAPQQQHSTQPPQRSPTSAGFFQTPGIGFFPPVHQTPSAQRQ